MHSDRKRRGHQRHTRGMELSSRSGTAGKGTAGNGRLEGMGRKAAMGGPLGKTKKITQRGIEDISNDMGAFTVVRAESNEAAAKLFENHPHFTIFPYLVLDLTAAHALWR